MQEKYSKKILNEGNIATKKPFAKYCRNSLRLSNKMINPIERLTLTFRRKKARIENILLMCKSGQAGGF